MALQAEIIKCEGCGKYTAEKDIVDTTIKKKILFKEIVKQIRICKVCLDNIAVGKFKV